VKEAEGRVPARVSRERRPQWAHRPRSIANAPPNNGIRPTRDTKVKGDVEKTINK